MLHVVGPLQLRGEGDSAAENAIDEQVARVAALLEGFRDERRAAMVGEHGTYVKTPGPLEPPQRAVHVGGREGQGGSQGQGLSQSQGQSQEATAGGGSQG